jgi:hypothetical protein
LFGTKLPIYCNQNSSLPLNSKAYTFKLIQSSIKIVDICLMVFFVMGLEKLTADHGFKSRVAEFEFRERDFSCLLRRTSESNSLCDRFGPHLMNKYEQKYSLNKNSSRHT